MFTRSYTNPAQNNGGQNNSLVSGGNAPFRTVAENSPSRLGMRIAEGEDVMAIWFDWENQEKLQSISQRIGFTLPSTAGMTGHNHLQSMHQMSKQEILEFCKTINVHPAHLVPLKPTPELSLPTPLLELLIEMSHGKGASNAEDIELAQEAVDAESKRINSFLYYKSRQEEPQNDAQNDDGSTSLTLMQVFSDVLDNPSMMTKLARESEGISATFQHKAYQQYPLALRVRNIAYTAILDKYARLMYRQKGKESLLGAALGKVETEYCQIFNSRKTDNHLLLFIGDIKDALFAQDIEPRAATIRDIVDVIKTFDLTDSRLEKSYQFFSDAYGAGASIDELANEFLTELAESVGVYFASEDRLSKTKRKVAEAIDALPARGDIEGLFEDKSFQDGTLFRHLMDNRVLIALASHNHSMQQQSPAPK